MDAAHIAELVSKFSDDISSLEEALEPLTKTNLNDAANKLPVLDRAKLFTFAAYSIESILFSNLRIAGVEAKSHPVFTELARVRQYFDKIKIAEDGEQRPRLRLNKEAVGRIIKHELSSNNSKNQGTKRKFDERGEAHVVSNDKDGAIPTEKGEELESSRSAEAKFETKIETQAGDKPEVEVEVEAKPVAPATPNDKANSALDEDIMMLSDAEDKLAKKKKKSSKKTKKGKKK